MYVGVGIVALVAITAVLILCIVCIRANRMDVRASLRPVVVLKDQVGTKLLNLRETREKDTASLSIRDISGNTPSAYLSPHSVIRNQGNSCGSCWAFSTTECFGDRVYRAHQQQQGTWEKAQARFKGKWSSTDPDPRLKVPVYSVDRVLQCSGINGCSGNDLVSAWAILQTYGTVDVKAQGVPRYDGDHPAQYRTQNQKCVHYPESQLLKASSKLYLAHSARQLRHEIYHYGPFSIAMKVPWEMYATFPDKDNKGTVGPLFDFYDDDVDQITKSLNHHREAITQHHFFASYFKTKTFEQFVRQVTDAAASNIIPVPGVFGDVPSPWGHSMRVVGWTQFAWIVANSWGPSWGIDPWGTKNKQRRGYLWLEKTPSTWKQMGYGRHVCGDYTLPTETATDDCRHLDRTARCGSSVSDNYVDCLVSAIDATTATDDAPIFSWIESAVGYLDPKTETCRRCTGDFSYLYEKKCEI